MSSVRIPDRLLPERISVFRRSGELASGFDPSAGAPSITVAPPEGYVVEIAVDGSGTFGGFTVAGTSGGLPDSQALVFTGTGRKTTTLKFDKDTLVTITPTGVWAGPTATAVAKGKTGHPLKIMAALVADIPCRIDRGNPDWPGQREGVQEIEKGVLFANADAGWTPRNGDELLTTLLTSERWRLEGVPPYAGSAAIHHYELNVERVKT